MVKITLTPAQSDVVRYLFEPTTELRFRFSPLVGPRGFGKTHLACTVASLALGELEQLPTWVPNKNIAILCGSHSQAIDIYYPKLAYEFGLGDRATWKSRRDGILDFVNGTRIKLWSADAYERLRGTGQYLIIADEFPSWSVPGGSIKDAWESVLQPTLITRWDPITAERYGAPSAGRALVPSTPRGKDYFYDMFNLEHEDSNWKSFHYDYNAAPHLNKVEIEKLRKQYDKIKFAREFLASFEDSGANVFYAFSRKSNVSEVAAPTELEPIHCGIDFNILINATTFSVVRGGQLQVFAESEGTANTEELARLIRAKFPKNKIVCYPDPTGKRRVSSSPIGQTDLSILKEAGFQVLAPNASPSIVDSVNAVNRKLENAAGEIGIVIDPSCKGLINSLERTAWMENRPETATIDKSQNVEHFSDGLRYLVSYLWPINHSKVLTANSGWF